MSAQGPQICVVQWGPRGTQPPYPFNLGVFLNIVEDDMERASYQRLSNLGYRMQPPPASVAAFQGDYGQTNGLTVTGKLDANTMKAIKTVHDACFHRLAN